MDRIPQLARVLAAMRRPETVERLLRELLTPSEAQRLSLRWEIVRMLSEGQSQRAIAHSLGVSLCKITRGSRELKRKGSMVKRVFERSFKPPQSASKTTSYANQSPPERR